MKDILKEVLHNLRLSYCNNNKFVRSTSGHLVVHRRSILSCKYSLIISYYDTGATKDAGIPVNSDGTK